MPEREKIFTGSWDETVKAVDANTGDEIWTFTGHSDSVWSVEASPTENKVFSGSDSGEIKAIDPETGSEIWTSNVHQDLHRVGDLAVSPDGSVLYSVSSDQTVKAIDTETGDEIWTFSGHTSTVSVVSISPDGGEIYTGSMDNTVKAIDADTGSEIWESTAHSNDVASIDAGVDGNKVFTGDKDHNVKALDAGTGDEIWNFDGHSGDVRATTPSPDGNNIYTASEDSTIKSLEADTGSEIWESNVHTGVIYGVDTGGGEVSDPVTGQVTDQHGDPVENSTVEAWGISEAAFDESAIDDLETEINSLERDLEDVSPEQWDTFADDFADAAGSPMLDLEAYRDDIGDTTYPLVHEEDDWGVGTTTIISSSVDDPRITTDADQPVIISLWDPDEGGTFIDNQVDQSFPGATTEGTVVIEQLGPSGVEDTRTVDTQAIYETTGATPWSTNDHHAVRTSLPEGVYRVHPEDNPAAGYTFTVGEPDAIFDSWTSDLENRLTNLEDRSDILSDELDLRENADFDHLLNEGIAVRQRTTTNETGHFELEADSNVRTLNVQAYKADDEILNIIESATDGEDPSLDDVSIQDLREYRLDGYNGSFYLPAGTTTVDTTQEEIDPADVNVYRTNALPNDDMERYEDLLEELFEEFMNESVGDLEGQWDELLEEIDDERLEEILENYRQIVDGNSDLEERIEEILERELGDSEDDLSNEELIEELEAIKEALDNQEDWERITGGEAEIDDGELFAEIPVPAWVDVDDAALLVHTSDGETQPIDDEYLSVNSGGLFGASTLEVDGYPVADDFELGDLEFVMAGEGGVGGGEVPIQNPAFDGTIPEIDALRFGTLSPGPDERVSVDIDADIDGGYERIANAEAFAPDRSELNTTIDSDRDRVSFRTAGEGDHIVRLTVESSTGHEFVISERVRAGSVSKSDPATIRAGELAGSPYAITGEHLESARISADDGEIQIDALAESSDDVPGELHLRVDSLLSGDTDEIELSVLQGNDERQVNRHVSVFWHLDGVEDGTLFESQGRSVTWDGDTRFGEVDDRDGKVVLVTYTDENGHTTMSANQDPNLIDRTLHRLDYLVPTWVPLVGSFLTPFLELISLIGAEVASLVTTTTTPAVGVEPALGPTASATGVTA
ncbi:PQQ-binding-like beta-propeller repeat protein (plasmid) [Natrialbaceae archaeon A-CW2]